MNIFDESIYTDGSFYHNFNNVTVFNKVDKWLLDNLNISNTTILSKNLINPINVTGDLNINTLIYSPTEVANIVVKKYPIHIIMNYSLGETMDLQYPKNVVYSDISKNLNKQECLSLLKFYIINAPITITENLRQKLESIDINLPICIKEPGIIQNYNGELNIQVTPPILDWTTDYAL